MSQNSISAVAPVSLNVKRDRRGACRMDRGDPTQLGATLISVFMLPFVFNPTISTDLVGPGSNNANEALWRFPRH